MIGLDESFHIGRIIEEIRFTQRCEAQDNMTKFLAKKCKRNNIKKGKKGKKRK